MSDEERLLNDLVQYVEGNYDGSVGFDSSEGYFILKTDEEVFVISVKKEKLEDWD